MNPLDVAPHPAAHLACPDCGEHIPVTLSVHGHDSEGAMVVEVDTDELWLHSFTHDSH